MTSIDNYEIEYRSDETDDLEQALVLAAADADARNSECPNEYFNEPNAKTENDSTDDESNQKWQTGDDAYVKYEKNYADSKFKEPHSSTKRKLNDERAPVHVESKAKRSGTEQKLTEKIDYYDGSNIPKNKRSRTSEGGPSFNEPIQGHAKVVAKHYNMLEEKGLDERAMSRIFFMRNFHNWIKSMLINEYLKKIKNNKKHNAPVRVHDMCCGKGGDLLKWRKGNINHLICSDIASVSIEQCKARYEDMKNRNSRDRNPVNLYTIEYIVADCTRIRLREKYKDPSMKLDLVSCQFANHYSFESLSQAECMLKNAGECLQPGGFFIGTIPDANELISRAQKSCTNTFGNSVYNVEFECNVAKPPLFGSKYNFHLDGCVDCPEFLVHFPTFIKLAKKFGLKFVQKEKFHDFYERMKEEGLFLLSNMKSLEPFPAQDANGLVGTDPDDYTHADDYKKRYQPRTPIGTLSKSEWEASSLYLTFVFEKVKNTWNEKGEPVYDI